MEEKTPRQTEAEEYLEKHRVPELLSNFTAQLIYHRPLQPKKFLIELLEKLMKARTTHYEYPCIFDESNVDSVFGMLDPTKKGYITLQQYKEAMKTLGVEKYDQHPSGCDVDKISIDVFTREAKQGLAHASATFQE